MSTMRSRLPWFAAPYTRLDFLSLLSLQRLGLRLGQLPEADPAAAGLGPQPADPIAAREVALVLQQPGVVDAQLAVVLLGIERDQLGTQPLEQRLALAQHHRARLAAVVQPLERAERALDRGFA